MASSNIVSAFLIGLFLGVFLHSRVQNSFCAEFLGQRFSYIPTLSAQSFSASDFRTSSANPPSNNIAEPVEPAPGSTLRKELGHDLAYESPRVFPFPPFRLVLERLAGECDLFKNRSLCSKWSAGELWEFDPHNREAIASVFGVDCFAARSAPSQFASGCVVIDIGQNVGLFSAYAASLGADVFGLEPQWDLWAAFNRSIEVNEQWRRQGQVVRSTPGLALWSASSTTKTKTVRVGCNTRIGGCPSAITHWDAPFVSLDRWLEPILAQESAYNKTLTLIKVDTDAADFALLAGFLLRISESEFRVNNFLFECAGFPKELVPLSGSRAASEGEEGKPAAVSGLPNGGRAGAPRSALELFRAFHRLGYSLYRLNVHIGLRAFSESGWDVVNDFALPKSMLIQIDEGAGASKVTRGPRVGVATFPHNTYEEFFSLRLMRNVWRVKNSFLAGVEDSETLKSLAWPWPEFSGHVQFLATRENFVEKVVWEPSYHGGPLLGEKELMEKVRRSRAKSEEPKK